MTRLVALLMVVFMATAPTIGRAQGWDYGAKLDVGLPLSGGFVFTGGYGFLLHGQKKKRGKGDWRYGFVRPNIRLYTAAVINRAELRFDLYPISIAGFTVGQIVAHRAKSLDDYDCATLTCTNYLNRSFIESKFVGGLAHVFALLSVRADYLASTDHKNGFLDESSGLRGTGHADWLTETSLILGSHGYKPWNGGFATDYLTMIRSNDSSHSLGLFATYDLGESWDFRVKTGVRRSTLFGHEFFFGISAAWTGRPSLEL